MQLLRRKLLSTRIYGPLLWIEHDPARHDGHTPGFNARARQGMADAQVVRYHGVQWKDLPRTWTMKQIWISSTLGNNNSLG